MEFDIRNTSEHVQELNTEGIRSPVVSLQYIPKDIQAGFRLLYIHIHTHVTTKILLSYQLNLCFALHFDSPSDGKIQTEQRGHIHL